MNLRFVEAFYWVATLKSVTRAAEKLSLTQSAMSSRIAALEDELGVMLLDRRDRQFRLTIPGMRFLVHAQRMLELQRDAKAEMGSGTEPAAPLRLGAIESVLHSWLIPWIEALRLERPALSLELTVETTPMLLEQMRRGTLDLAFAALPAAGEGVRTRALPPMEMVFVGNARRHRRARCSLAELAETDLLTFQRGSQPHVAMLDLFRHARLEPRRVHAVSSISAMTQLVGRRLRRGDPAAQRRAAAAAAPRAAPADDRPAAAAVAGVRELPLRRRLARGRRDRALGARLHRRHRATGIEEIRIKKSGIEKNR